MEIASLTVSHDLPSDSVALEIVYGPVRLELVVTDSWPPSEELAGDDWTVRDNLTTLGYDGTTLNMVFSVSGDELDSTGL
tara:strand:+ start:65 stop:304 length:240 start_codon:yes stop_codon:yes gene_type:complete